MLEMERFLIYMKSEICYAKNPMPAFFREASERNFPYLHGWIEQMAEGLKTASRRTFASVWREAGETWLSEELKEDAVVHSFLRLGDEIGGMDLESQVKCLDLFLRDLGQAAADAKAELPVKKKLYLSLGVMAGVFLAVILI